MKDIDKLRKMFDDAKSRAGRIPVIYMEENTMLAQRILSLASLGFEFAIYNTNTAMPRTASDALKVSA